MQKTLKAKSRNMVAKASVGRACGAIVNETKTDTLFVTLLAL